MNRLDQVLLIAKEINVSKRTANLILNSIVENITLTLEKGGKVTLVGFGTFKVTERAERTITHPKTKMKIKIQAHKVPVFKAGKRLKDIIQP
jgi:DNA-binding protein HU-beta